MFTVTMTFQDENMLHHTAKFDTEEAAALEVRSMLRNWAGIKAVYLDTPTERHVFGRGGYLFTLPASFGDTGKHKGYNE